MNEQGPPTLDDSPAAHDRYVHDVAVLLDGLDQRDRTAWYVQAFVVAESGTPSTIWRWAGDQYEEVTRDILLADLLRERGLDTEGDDAPNLLGPSEVTRGLDPDDPGRRSEVPPVPWAAIAWTIARVLLVAVLMVLAAWAGYTLGLRDHREERRTRTAVCQVLDQLGADPSTAAQAYPCRDTPAPGPGQ